MINSTYLFKNQQSLPSNNTNQAFGNHVEQKIPSSNTQPFGSSSRILSNGQNSTSRPQLPQNEIQSQAQKLKKSSQTIQRQTSLPTQQHEFTRMVGSPGSTYSDPPSLVPAYEGSLKSRRASDSNFQKESRQAIVGEIERLKYFLYLQRRIKISCYKIVQIRRKTKRK